MDDLSLLQQAFPEIETELDFPFARHTTIGSGGIASLAISPPNAERAAECIESDPALLSRGGCERFTARRQIRRRCREVQSNERTSFG